MRNSRRSWLAFVCGMVVSAVASAAAAPADDGGVPLDGEAQRTARWVLQQADHRGRPFAVVDKKQARIHVFEPSGARVGASAVLIGLTSGDRDAVPNLGTRPVATLLPHERTTPAGRFDTEPGHNDKGEAIVWFQYDAALAIHRLRPAPAHERRPERMASPDPTERRITFGCVVVPVAFYEAVIAPTLGARRGVVYVLPETGSIEALLREQDLALRSP
jgi:hypothetical protein